MRLAQREATGGDSGGPTSGRASPKRSGNRGAGRKRGVKREERALASQRSASWPPPLSHVGRHPLHPDPPLRFRHKASPMLQRRSRPERRRAWPRCGEEMARTSRSCAATRSCPWGGGRCPGAPSSRCQASGRMPPSRCSTTTSLGCGRWRGESMAGTWMRHLCCVCGGRGVGSGRPPQTW